MTRTRTSAIALLLSLLLAFEPAPSTFAQVPAIGLDGLGLAEQLGGASLAGLVDGSLVFLGEGPRVVAYQLDEEGRALRLGQSEVLPGVVRDLSQSPDGTIAAATGAGGIWLIEADESSRVVGGLATRRRITHVAWSGPWLVGGDATGAVVLYEHVDGRLRERDLRLFFSTPLLDLAPTDGGVLALHAPFHWTNVGIDSTAGFGAIAQFRHGDQGSVASRGGRTLAVGRDALYLLGFEAGGEPLIDRAWPGGGHALALSGQGAWTAHTDYVTRFRGATWETLRPLAHGARADWPIDTLVVTEDDRFALAAGRESQTRSAIRRSDAWNAAGLATFASTPDGLELRSAEDRPGDLVRIVEAELPGLDGSMQEGRTVVLGHDRRAVWAFPVLDGSEGVTRTVGAPYPIVLPGTWAELRDIAVWKNRLFVAEKEAVHVLDLAAPQGPATLEMTIDRPGARRVWAADGLLTIGYSFFMLYYELPDDGPPEPIEFELPPDDSWGGPGFYMNVAIQDGLLIGSTTGQFEIIDMSDPQRPNHLSRRRVVTAGVPRTRRAESVVALDEGVLALSTGAVLEIHDLSDPRVPRRLAAVDMPEMITDLFLADGYVYAAVVDHGVFRFDLRVPSLPDEAGWLRLRDLGENASLVVRGDHVFVGGGTAPGPRVLDITGGWGLVVAEIDAAPPTATPGSPTVPSPSPTLAATPIGATATPRAPTPMPSRVPWAHVLSLPWLLHGG